LVDEVSFHSPNAGLRSQFPDRVTGAKARIEAVTNQPRLSRNCHARSDGMAGGRERCAWRATNDSDDHYVYAIAT
jgi:hypothetical protein